MPEHVIEISSLPSTIEEFVALRDQLATTFLGGTAVFVVALYTYSENLALGIPFLTVAIEREQLADGIKGYKGKEPTRRIQAVLQQRIGRAPHIARSYFAGTSPENGYTLPAPPLRVLIREQARASDFGDGRAKVFVHSTGADTPRPIHLSQNNRGIWKAKNWSSLEVGVRKPSEVVDDDL